MPDGSKKEIEQIREILIDLQAEISALRALMFEKNPNLGQEFQRRVDDLKEKFHKARQENIRS